MTNEEIKAERAKLNETQLKSLRSKFGTRIILELRVNGITDAIAVKFKEGSGTVYEWTMILTARGKIIDARCIKL